MPNIGYDYTVEIPESEKYNTYTSERFPVGTLGWTQSGREFRFAQAGGVALVTGNVVCGPAVVTNHSNQTATATAAGAVSISVTLGATAATANQYKDGYICITDGPTGGQLAYKLDAHAAIGSGGTATLQLAAGESVQVAITSSHKYTLVSNPYRGVIQCPATTLTSPPVGVAIKAQAISGYGWVQTRGISMPLIAGTIIIGEQVVSPTGTAGACGPNSAGGSETETIIGRVSYVAATGKWGVIDLDIGN